MAVALKYVHRNPQTGLLSYRRAYPAELRPHLPDNRIQLKRSLKATRLEEAGAMARYQVAHAEYETTAATARKKLEGRYDVLDPPKIAYLAATYKYDWLLRDDEIRQSGNERGLELQKEGIDWFLSDWRAWEATGQLLEITDHWRKAAHKLLADQNIVIASDETDEFAALCYAINKVAIEAGRECLARFQGQRTIEAPQRPFKALTESISSKPLGLSFDAIARTYMGNERNPISESSRESIRTALKFFKDVHGEPTPQVIDASTVNSWLELMANRPAKLPADARSLPLRDLQERFRDQPHVPRMSPKTQEKYVNALSQAWKQSQSTGLIDRTLANPFHGHTFKAIKKSSGRKGYQTQELQAIFDLPLFHGEKPNGQYADVSYWVPLLLLWTGARPEEVAQLLVTDIAQCPQTSEWLITYTDDGDHPVKGPRNLKTSHHNSGQRTFPVPSELLRLGLIEYISSQEAAGHSAIFPTLRSKAARGLLFTNYGKWWVRYVKKAGILADGRKASREFRHNWATAAHECGIPREAMEYIMGHKDSSTSAHSQYGNRQALGRRIHDIRYKGLDLSRVLPWEPLVNIS